MTVVVILNVALVATVLAVIVGALLWAIVTQEPESRSRSLHLFRELRIRPLDLARAHDVAQPQISQELQ
jgi:hypothetical protein